MAHVVNCRLLFSAQACFSENWSGIHFPTWIGWWKWSDISITYAQTWTPGCLQYVVPPPLWGRIHFLPRRVEFIFYLVGSNSFDQGWCRPNELGPTWVQGYVSTSASAAIRSRISLRGASAMTAPILLQQKFLSLFDLHQAQKKRGSLTFYGS